MREGGRGGSEGGRDLQFSILLVAEATFALERASQPSWSSSPASVRFEATGIVCLSIWTVAETVSWTASDTAKVKVSGEEGRMG